MLASVRLTSARSATLLVLLAAAAISPATGFFSTHLPLARRSRGSHCSAIMAAQHPRPERTLGDGDRALKSAAVALGDGKIKHAGRLVAWARQLYKNLGVRDREPLLIAIERRVAKDLTAQVPVFAPTISSQLASRVAMTHGEGDSLLYEASVALGTRELTKARMLAEEARAAFAEAGDVVLRERQPLVDNLLRYVVAEEERHEKIRRAKVKATKKSQEQAKLQQRFYILYHHKASHAEGANK